MNEIDTGSVRLRPQTDDDNDFLLELYTCTRKAELIDIGWSEPEIEKFLFQQFEAQTLSYRAQYPHASFDIVEFQAKAIGRLYVDRDKSGHRLIDISLLPGFRNQGLGMFLIRSVLGEAARNDCSVSLHVERNNPARGLYECMGFVLIEDRGVHLFMQWIPGNDQ